MTALPILLACRKTGCCSSVVRVAYDGPAKAACPPTCSGPASAGPQSALLDLTELQIDRRGPTEDRDLDLQARPLLIDLLDHAVERGEWPIRYTDLLPDLEGDRWTRPLYSLLNLGQDPLGLGIRDRHGLGITQ